MKSKFGLKLNNQGKFALAKYLAVILVIGLVIVFSAAALNISRMRARDSVRAQSIAKINQALLQYFSNSLSGYPFSTGECLQAASGVGAELVAAKVLPELPTDPLWPMSEPIQSNGAISVGQEGFCYFYYSDKSNNFKLSYFLESNSRAGKSGINIATNN